MTELETDRECDGTLGDNIATTYRSEGAMRREIPTRNESPFALKIKSKGGHFLMRTSKKETAFIKKLAKTVKLTKADTVRLALGNLIEKNLVGLKQPAVHEVWCTDDPRQCEIQMRMSSQDIQALKRLSTDLDLSQSDTVRLALSHLAHSVSVTA
jgi:hypothetical protein